MQLIATKKNHTEISELFREIFTHLFGFSRLSWWLELKKEFLAAFLWSTYKRVNCKFLKIHCKTNVANFLVILEFTGRRERRLSAMTTEITSASGTLMVNVHALVDAARNLQRGKSISFQTQQKRVERGYQATTQPAAKNSDEESTNVSDESRRGSRFRVHLASTWWADCVCGVWSEWDDSGDNLLGGQDRLLGCHRCSRVHSIYSWKVEKTFEFQGDFWAENCVLTLSIAGWSWWRWNESVRWWVCLAHFCFLFSST